MDLVTDQKKAKRNKHRYEQNDHCQKDAAFPEITEFPSYEAFQRRDQSADQTDRMREIVRITDQCIEQKADKQRQCRYQIFHVTASPY